MLCGKSTYTKKQDQICGLKITTKNTLESLLAATESYFSTLLIQIAQMADELI